MNIIQSNILGSYATLSFIENNLISEIKQNTTNAFSYNICIDDNTKINVLKNKIKFKNDLIALTLVNNRELLDCLTETVEIIASNGIYFHANLDLVNEDGEQRFLLIYYPIKLNNINIYEIRFSNDKSFNDYDTLYKSIVRNLFKYSINLKKSIIIDEQYL